MAADLLARNALALASAGRALRVACTAADSLMRERELCSTDEASRYC